MFISVKGCGITIIEFRDINIFATKRPNTFTHTSEDIIQAEFQKKDYQSQVLITIHEEEETQVDIEKLF